MGVEFFDTGKFGDCISLSSQGIAIVLDNAGTAVKLIDGQTAEKTRCAACRQDVTRPGNEISDRLRRPGPQESEYSAFGNEGI